MSLIEVDIIFDFVCAWCYIGKRNLEMAISLYQKTYPGGKHDTLAINWRPYYLNYGPSTHSIDKREVADVKLSDMSTEQRERLYRRMNQIGRSVGINFKEGGKVGDTRLAHTLVRLSGTKGPEVQNALVEAIFRAYHQLEKDISRKEVLGEIGISAGLNAAEVDEWLDSEEEMGKVDLEAEKNREFLTGEGVPTYIIQGGHLDGRPDAEDFIEAIIKAREREAS
ncbi:hypothetical protein ACJ41O_007666 [Fusarium nematophilum]